MHTVHLLGRAFHVHCAHLVGDGAALGLGHWSQALRFEEFDARSFRAQVGLEAAEDDGRRGAEVQHFGVPLQSISIHVHMHVQGGVLMVHTLSRTFSSEFGQSMAKQTKSRSVSGYESGRSRSYSSCPAVSHSANSTIFPDCLCSTCVM